jgi:hypothetical protein
MELKKMELNINLINEILNYLARQPYKEVAHIINGILHAQQNTQGELPLNED